MECQFLKIFERYDLAIIGFSIIPELALDSSRF